MALTLSQSLRQRLKEPFGELVSDIGPIAGEISGGFVVSVGDKVTVGLLRNNIKPQVCVYDGRTKRIKIAVPRILKEYDAREVKVKNPPGALTSEALEQMESALRSAARTKIVVDGEEDLFTIAAIKYAPMGAYVLYGQPDRGVVKVKVDESAKKKIDELISEMESKSDAPMACYTNTQNVKIHKRRCKRKVLFGLSRSILRVCNENRDCERERKPAP
jgi:GTP-dependent dephospho-CoA kinase